MEITLVILIVVSALVPSVAKMMDSVAYRNHAAGRAEIIRANRGGEKDGEGRVGRSG
ncbi:hypothetical protein ACFT08_26920 [Streptomyces rochei]|uniref:hypothetical protein n=1 Tax=Streptomyces TaxID=1883 RepID=UPI000B0BA8A7|nr:hypothetical protein [Streptomyces sp. RT42]MBQ0882793.1 hypothetical protein [Streptomyces sp. RT42]NEB62054.1 hypothetical protein [Streptomyces diastaticus]NED00230.1 hypothetical protein [Streptomyces sp. SID6648]